MYYFYMKSLQESLFDSDLVQKGVPMNIEDVEDYVLNTIKSYDFKKENSYDSLSRSYSIKKQQRIFYLNLIGHISYVDTYNQSYIYKPLSHGDGLSRAFDYEVRIYFAQYDKGAVVNYVDIKFCPGATIQEEGFSIIPNSKTDHIDIKTNNIKETLDKYVNLFDKIEEYFHSNEFIKIVKDGKLDKPEWGLSTALYNRRLSKYNANVKEVIKDLKNIVKEFKK